MFIVSCLVSIILCRKLFVTSYVKYSNISKKVNISWREATVLRYFSAGPIFPLYELLYKNTLENDRYKNIVLNRN